MKKHIPNFITLGNLLCGTIATVFAVQGDFVITAILVMGGIIFDFFDGFVARILNVQAELGKQLDSLADMVTSGVVPAIVMYKLIEKSVIASTMSCIASSSLTFFETYLPYVGFLLALGAGYRLAKFNIDTRQTDSFIGMPTPAMNLFVIALPLVYLYSEPSVFVSLFTNTWFLVGITVVLTYLMNAELALFSLKFKDYSFKNNKIKYIFLITSLLFLILLKFVAFPIIILLYVVFSIISNVKTS